MSPDDTDALFSEALRQVRGRLLDLSMRNRLLNYRPRSRSIPILGEAADALVDRLVNRAATMELLGFDGEPADAGLPELAVPAAGEERQTDRFLQTAVRRSRLDRTLRNLSAEAHRAIDETGTNILYLAIGMLHWRDPDDTEHRRAPLLLIPVQLERSQGPHGLVYRVAWSQEDVETNLSLEKLLQERHGLRLPPLPDDDNLTVEPYLKAVAEAVGGGSGDWQVRHEAVIDIFSFARLFMFLDLDPANWPSGHNPADHPLLQQLVAGRAGTFPVRTDRYPPERQTTVDQLPLIYDADSAQTTAILDVLDGHNLVIEGPPGTGKSQTIANLIGIFLHEGKSVLFLSEKQAALEVVHNRLDRAGLAPYLLELHSHRLQRSALADALKERLQLRYRKNRELVSPLPEYQQLRARLDQWAAVLGMPVDSAGTTVHQIFWQFEAARTTLADGASRLGPFAFPPMPAAASWDGDALARRMEVAETIARTLQGSIPARSPWHGFWPRQLTPADLPRVTRYLDLLGTELRGLEEVSRAFIAACCPGIEATLPLARDLAALPETALDALPAATSGDLLHRLTRAEARQQATALLDLLRDAEMLSQEVAVQAPALPTLSDQDLARLQRLLRQAGQEGWSESRLADIHQLGAAAAGLAAAQDGLPTLTPGLEQLGLPVPGTLDDLQRLAADLTFWREQTPADASLYLDAPIFRQATLALLLQAREEAEKLAELQKTVSKNATLEPRPDLLEIQSVIATLSEYGDSFTSIFSRRWRAADRRVPQLLKRVPVRTDTVLSNLRKICSFLESCIAFNSNARYCEGLGMIFHGENTNWADAERILAWGATAGARASNTLVAELTDDFDRTMRSLRALHAEIDRITTAITLHGGVLAAHPVGGGAPGPELRLSVLRARAAAVTVAIAPIVAAAPTGTGAQRVADLEILVIKEARARCANAATATFGNAPAELFGALADGRNTATAPLREVVNALNSLTDAGLPEAAIAFMAAAPGQHRLQLRQHLSAIAAAWQRVQGAAAAFNPIGTLDLHLLNRDDVTIAAATAAVQARLTKLDELLPWAAWSRLREEARNLDMAPMLAPVESGQINSALAAAVFAWCRCGTLLDRALAQHPILQEIPGSRRRVLAQRFRELDRELATWNIHRIHETCSRRRVPAGIGDGPIRSRTEQALIRHESSKSRSHLPVRQLLTRAGAAMQALKPCFMMSPLAVARFLPHGLSFDVLIVDEASQLRPEDCLGAIARCRQLVVVGDPKQLPPTAFFDRLLNDDPEIDCGEDSVFDHVESILDVVSANLAGGRRLLWHYRSRHEDLIRFSNSQFYGDSLTAFPTPRPKVAGRGIELRYLADGRFAGGVNRIEALAVAAEAAALLLSNAPGSIGIAAFNAAQRDCIDDALDRLALANPALMASLQARSQSDEPLFIKNLENVQGDERDIMLLSFTYGPDAADGRVYQRFGPINGAGGWRRLNVLFTRARERIVVFTSLLPEQITVTPESAAGVRALRDYLRYAAAPDADRRERRRQPPRPGTFAAPVCRRLTAAGLPADTAIGDTGCTLEVAVRDPATPGAYLLGIESDGPDFHDNPVARERERLRPEVLARLGWNLHTIHSVDWFRDPESEAEAILKACRPEGNEAPES